MFTTQANQLLIISVCGFLCLMNSIMALVVNQRNPIRKLSIFYLEFVTAALMFSDFYSRIYEATTQSSGYYILRIANFLQFFLIYAEVFGLNIFIRTLIKPNESKIPKRLNFAMLMTSFGTAIIIASHFLHLFYYFDENNHYIRGKYFLLSYIFPLFIYIILFSVIIEYRKAFSELIFVSLLIFALLPLLGGILQGFYTGHSYFNFSIALSAEALFMSTLIDQNNYLLKVASEDRMTHLPNAYGFMMNLGKKIAMKQLTKYNAYYFDLIRMGLLNQKYGPETGDAIIIEYARLISSRLTDDEVLGRLGGNYFVALIEKAHTDEFIKMVSNSVVHVDTPQGPMDINISANIGGYEIRTNNITPANIVSYTSMAVNLSKNVLKKQVVFLTPELQHNMFNQKQTLEHIPKAMKLKELRPYYQPKVNSSTKTLIGGEALVRWERNGEVIPPFKFIPMMEQNESICSLDFYMLDYVCSDLKKWIDEGLNPPIISINFSRRNLGNKNLAEEISNVIVSHKIPPSLIQIEITETNDEYPIEVLQDFVSTIKKYGMTAAIDDFGTGSSSIRVLKDVSFDVLKIDKSFVDSNETKDLNLLNLIIAMAKSTDAEVIAEGVENIEQIETLHSLGCDDIQGYYFDKPLPRSEFEKRLKNPTYS